MIKNLALKAALISALAFALSMVLMQPFAASATALFSSPEKNDFTLSDFYILTADSRAVARRDTNIVIINIDRADRADIAKALDLVGLCGPAAVGLDVVFADEREGDQPLLEALARTPRLVQPLTLVTDTAQSSEDVFRIAEMSYFREADTSGIYASTALPSKFSNSMVREFRPAFRLTDGSVIDGFPLALARIVKPEAARTVDSRHHSLETINFHSRRFFIIEPEEIMDRAADIHGRVVLFGAVSEPADLHATPVNSAMPGVLVHAHALATVLDSDYLTLPPRWIQFTVAYILCFLIVYLALRNTTKTKGLMLRLIQIACALTLVQMGYWLFVRHNVVFDTSNALLMVLFGLFAVDIWLGVEGLIERASDSKFAHRLRTRLSKNSTDK